MLSLCPQNLVDRLPRRHSIGYLGSSDSHHTQRVFHVLEVYGVMDSHRKALANHARVRSSLLTLSSSIHDAEVLLNAGPITVDHNDPIRVFCYDDPRIKPIGEFSVSVRFPNVAGLPVCGNR